VRATTRTGLALAVAVLAVSLGGGAAAQSPEQAPGRTGTPPTALAREGYHLYGRYCLPCHGANGAGIERPRPIGTGPGRPSEKQSGYGPSLRGVGALSADFYLRTGYMPLSRVGVQPHRRANVLLDEREIDALVAYVAWLAQGPKIPEPHPERGSLSEGLQLFTEHCAGCHQVVARGGYVNGAVAPPLEHATPRQIAEAVRIGPYVMPRYRKSDLSDGQLDSIVRYVRYAAKSPNHDGGWGIGFIGPIPEGMVLWLFGALAAIAACLAIGRRLRS
jgi:ubiquinol-cytochrome c reductase cytochrome c subunit